MNPFDHVRYDPETGVFTRLKNSGKARAGMPSGSLGGHKYVRIGILGQLYYAHRLAWFMHYGKWPDGEIDHINGNKCDNRISNLRDVPHFANQQNMRSARKHNASRLLGVSRCSRSGKWRARIKTGYKERMIGRYDTPEEAHDAYLREKASAHPYQTISEDNKR